MKNIYVCIIESLCYTSETNTTVYINYTLINMHILYINIILIRLYYFICFKIIFILLFI